VRSRRRCEPVPARPSRFGRSTARLPLRARFWDALRPGRRSIAAERPYGCAPEHRAAVVVARRRWLCLRVKSPAFGPGSSAAERRGGGGTPNPLPLARQDLARCCLPSRQGVKRGSRRDAFTARLAREVARPRGLLQRRAPAPIVPDVHKGSLDTGGVPGRARISTPAGVVWRAWLDRGSRPPARSTPDREPSRGSPQPREPPRARAANAKHRQARESVGPACACGKHRRSRYQDRTPSVAAVNRYAPPPHRARLRGGASRQVRCGNSGARAREEKRGTAHVENGANILCARPWLCRDAPGSTRRRKAESACSTPGLGRHRVRRPSPKCVMRGLAPATSPSRG
jgi:hypothetical protein